MYGELEFYKAVISSISKGSKKTWGLFLVAFWFVLNTCCAQTDTKASLWQLDASTKLSVAFASQNNHQPESAFGHVFLVVHHQNPPEPNAHVIEFVGHLESFGDMLATIHDKVDGRYRVLEFSEKSLDYDLENRDLHLLELAVETRQIEQLLAGVDARLGRTFPYTFAKYNCAYYLALLLEEQGWVTKSVSTRLYVEPVDLMKSVDDQRIRRTSFIPSSHLVLAHYSSQLPSDQLQALGRFVRGDDAVLVQNEPTLNQAISAYIRYQLPREPEAWRRQHLADAQKSVWHPVPDDMSSVPGADSRGHYEFSIYSGGALGLKFQPELRNFFNIHTQDQAGAYLELMSTEVVEQQGRLELNQFTLFKSESIHPESYKSRLLEIAYRYWGLKTNRSEREAYLTWGLGGAVNVKGLSFAVTPNLTLAATNEIQNRTNLRFGYRALTELHNARFSLRFQTDHWVNSPFEFSRQNLVQMRIKLTKQTNLGLEFGGIPQLDRSFHRLLITHSL